MSHTVDTASSFLHPSPTTPTYREEITPFWWVALGVSFFLSKNDLVIKGLSGQNPNQFPPQPKSQETGSRLLIQAFRRFLASPSRKDELNVG